MGKRSSRMAKRDDFENGIKAAEEAIGLLGKDPPNTEAPEAKKDDDASVGKTAPGTELE